MKIAIASNDGTRITGHVGRCKLFIIYDSDGTNITGKEIRENSFTHHGKGNSHQEEDHHHGEGHRHGHERLVDALKDCSYLLFQGGGWRLIDDLKSHGIVPVLTSEINAEDAVVKLLKGELKNEEDLACSRH